jgi:hypothetical protein
MEVVLARLTWLTRKAAVHNADDTAGWDIDGLGIDKADECNLAYYLRVADWAFNFTLKVKRHVLLEQNKPICYPPILPEIAS